MKAINETIGDLPDENLLHSEEIEEVYRLQQYELNILKEVVDVCDRFNLKYYLAEGTLLGAIRHHGFIPWDDDIDVCMPRNDYERFLLVAPKALPAHLFIKNIHYEKDDEKNITLTTRIMDHRYEVFITEVLGFPSREHVLIDILPLDGIPSNYIFRRLHFVRFFVRHKMFRCSQFHIVDKSKLSSWWKKAGLSLVKKAHMDRMNTKRLAIWCDRLLQKYSFATSDLSMNFLSEYKKKTIFPCSYYGNGRMVPFEDAVFRIPDKAEKILEQEYGDYMTPPPLEERKPKHNIMLIN